MHLKAGTKELQFPKNTSIEATFRKSDDDWKFQFHSKKCHKVVAASSSRQKPARSKFYGNPCAACQKYLLNTSRQISLLFDTNDSVDNANTSGSVAKADPPCRNNSLWSVIYNARQSQKKDAWVAKLQQCSLGAFFPLLLSVQEENEEPVEQRRNIDNIYQLFVAMLPFIRHLSDLSKQPTSYFLDRLFVNDFESNVMELLKPRHEKIDSKLLCEIEIHDGVKSLNSFFSSLAAFTSDVSPVADIVTTTAQLFGKRLLVQRQVQ